jgi:hypothetical protein
MTPPQGTSQACDPPRLARPQEEDAQRSQRTPGAAFGPPRRDVPCAHWSQDLQRRALATCVLDAPLLALESAHNLVLPAVLDNRYSRWREVDGLGVLQARTELRVRVRMGLAELASMLMNRVYALHVAGGTTERLLHGVTQDALGQAAVEAREAFRGLVVDGEDKAEVDRVSESSRVLDQGLPDGLLVAAEGAVAGADPVQLPPLAALQPLFPMRDVTHLVRGTLRTVVVAPLHEEHLSASLPSPPPGSPASPVPRR